MDDYAEINRFFDRKSRQWHFSEKDKKNAAIVLQRLSCQNPGVILDVGCGTGDLCPFLRNKYSKSNIVGLDLSLKMLRKIRTDYDFILQGNAEKIPLRGNSVDLVLNYCVYPHFINKLQAVSEAYRVLKPGGQYYILHPDGRQVTDQIHRSQAATVTTHLLPDNRDIYKSFVTGGFRVFQQIDDDFFLFAGEK